MANNRLWLVHRPTGAYAFLGKRMAEGWYGGWDVVYPELEDFWKQVNAGGPTGQDDFVLAIEDASGAPGATEDWTYVDHQPVLSRKDSE